jgi:hypothetical protein
MALTKKKKMLLIGGGVAVAAAAGYLLWANWPQVAALATGAPAATGTMQSVILGPAAPALVSLSLSNHDYVSLTAPTGATLGTASVSPTGIVVVPASGANYEYVAAAVGSTVITATYTDTSGITQTTTIQVTVTA